MLFRSDIVESTFCGKPGWTMDISITVPDADYVSRQSFMVVEQGNYLLAYNMGMNDESAAEDLDSIAGSCTALS